MYTRRHFLLSAAATSMLVSTALPVLASPNKQQALHATAITQVFGEGIRLIAIAIEFAAPLNRQDLHQARFSVAGRSVRDVYLSRSGKPGRQAASGRFVILQLSAGDTSAGLAQKLDDPNAKPPAPGTMPAGPDHGGPGHAGDIPFYDTVYKKAEAVVSATASAGTANAIADFTLPTDRVDNLVVDDFIEQEFLDPDTGKLLRYNLFLPKGHETGKSYPLVLFMHDAGATSDVTRTTLYQGLGAVAWASAEDQAARPCFVLAPQYAEIIADDDSKTSTMMDSTIKLIRQLTAKYRIDSKRIYATGQSGGCMMSIAMNIKYPDFFAASLLVAGQWDPQLVRPLAKKKLWIVVSQDDDKAYPGQNAILDVLAGEGARISRAVWNGNWNAKQFRTAFNSLDAQHSPINYVAFQQGSVIPAGQSSAGAAGHRNTWRIAYGIPALREWIFRQHL